MKEITRIITVRITEIADISDREPMTKDECEKVIKDNIKKLFCIDDVVVDNIQDFIMEKEGEVDA